MQIAEFQKLIEAIYFERDNERGLHATHMWFAEEVGELTRALRRGQQEELEGEFLEASHGVKGDVRGPGAPALSARRARGPESASRSERGSPRPDRRNAG